nr:hypothetical protein [Tanacetum cinerariifolium]
LEKANKSKSSKLRHLRKVGASRRVESFDDMEDVFYQGRMIDDMDMDEGIDAASVTIPAASATIPAAKRTIPAAVAPIVVAAYTRRRKGVIIRDPEEELPMKTPAETPKVKDKGKGILVETPKPMKKKDQIELDAEYAKKLHEEINKDYEEFTRFDENMRFLFKSREEMEEEDQEIIKSINETPAQKAAKRRKLSEEAQEAEDLKKRLEVVEDEEDDVFVEATPLASKVPVVDYQIVLIDNKPRYPLSRFTLEQLVNVTRLQVKEESEMSLELLRFTRQ